MEQERNKRPSQHLLITMHSAGSRTGGGICYWCYIHQLGSNCTAQLTKSPIGYMKIHRISVNPSVLSCPEVLTFSKQTERKVTSLVLDNIDTKTNKMARTSSRHPCVNTPGVPSFPSLPFPLPAHALEPSDEHSTMGQPHGHSAVGPMDGHSTVGPMDTHIQCCGTNRWLFPWAERKASIPLSLLWTVGCIHFIPEGSKCCIWKQKRSPVPLDVLFLVFFVWFLNKWMGNS